MAKRNRNYGRRKWEPQPEDAINLATIRWFALMTEAKAIEIYGTDQAVYPKILEVLNDCLSRVAKIKAHTEISDPGDCPPGWVPCGDECAPRCMDEEEDSR